MSDDTVTTTDGGTEQWRLEALREAQTVAEKASHAVRMPALHAIVARGHRDGERWNQEKLLSHWQGRYAPERVEALRQAVTTSETSVLARAPQYRAQLEYLDQLYNPELIEAALKTWGSWPQ